MISHNAWLGLVGLIRRILEPTLALNLGLCGCFGRLSGYHRIPLAVGVVILSSIAGSKLPCGRPGNLLQIPNQLFFSALKTRFSASELYVGIVHAENLFDI
jgi:hypothetical protein